MPASALRSVFCKSLAYAWKEAKTKSVRAAETAKALVGMVVRSVSKIRDAIISLECQDRLTHADWLFMATLKAELAEAQRRENPALAA